MLTIDRSTKFKKDAKKALRQGLDLTELLSVVARLAAEEPLDKQHKDHDLIGNRKGHRDCHIKDDWVLIYKIEGGSLILSRMGTHSELFG